MSRAAFWVLITSMDLGRSTTKKSVMAMRAIVQYVLLLLPNRLVVRWGRVSILHITVRLKSLLIMKLGSKEVGHDNKADDWGARD